MKEEAKKAFDRVQSKLGQRFGEFAALLLQRKIEEKSPQEVVKEVLAKFGKDLDVKDLEQLAIFIKY